MEKLSARQLARLLNLGQSSFLDEGRLRELGLIEFDGGYHLTARGEAHVRAVLAMALPDELR